MPPGKHKEDDAGKNDMEEDVLEEDAGDARDGEPSGSGDVKDVREEPDAEDAGKREDDSEDEDAGEVDASENAVCSCDVTQTAHHDFDESAQVTSERIRRWFESQGWKGNPFVLNIIPSLFVGYEIQKHKLISCVEQKHKVCLVVGATGSGKTTALRWLAENFGKEHGFRAIFISKPPATPEEFIEIFNRELFNIPWYLLIFKPIMPHIKNISSVPYMLNQKFRKEHLLILCDEIHEADVKVLQWLRVMADQVENLSLVISGLPSFEQDAANEVETFLKRITEKVSLTSLSREDTKEMIERRIRYMAASDSPKNPFTEDSIDYIYRETGGFPREILRLCDKAVNEAIRKGTEKIDLSLFSEKKIEEKQQAVSFDLRSMPRRQREIIEAIRAGKSTPGDIIDAIDLKKYKSKSHAIRSVNNILQRMMKEGLIEREKQGKTFGYTLSPKLRSMAVRA